jgi:spore maturation protein CgeB
MFPLSGYRKEIVLALYNEFGNSFGAWGMNHKISEGTTNFSQEYEAAIYRGAKIGVNVSHFNYGMYSSDRMFRMMGSGVFCLSHYFDGIEDMFTIGKHLDVFHSIDELKERIRYYMDNPMLRNSIAENGANHVLMNYTYDHMVNNIIELSK